MIKITVETRQATVEETELITTGSVGIPVEFGFSSDWDGLSKVAVFRVGDNPDWYDMILDETNACVIPWEILTTEFEGEPVFIGVEGTDRLTNMVVVPTIWVSVGAVKPGAHSGNAESADPTATQWSQIRLLAEQAASDAESAQESAETAETYVSHTPVVIDDYWNVWDGEKYVPTAQKAKGDDGDPGQDGQDGFSPVVEVEAISGGHTVTITDSTGSDTFNVMDGADGQDGQDGRDGQDGQDGQPGPPGLAVQATAPTTGVLAWLDTDDDSTVTLVETSDLVPIQNALNNLDAGDVAYDSTETYSSGTVGAMLADVSLHKADVYESVVNIPANSSVSLPFSGLNITMYKAYFITAFGTDNASWKWAGIFFYSVNGASLDAITTSFLTATISGTNLVITNTHQEYGMNIAIKII